MARAGSRAIGLDGVVAQQENYCKSGFVFAYNNIRYGGWVAPRVEATPTTVSLTDVPFDLIARDDATVFPAPRPTFLNTWIAAPGHIGRALIRDRRLVGWGVIRPCRTGRKIGPLIADDRDAAEAVFAALVRPAGGQVFLDVPQPNGAALALATAHGFAAVFETARMYSGPIQPVSLERVFGDDVRTGIGRYLHAGMARHSTTLSVHGRVRPTSAFGVKANIVERKHLAF